MAQKRSTKGKRFGSVPGTMLIHLAMEKGSEEGSKEKMGGSQEC